MTDQLNLGKKSIYREGYGIVAKVVMRDKDLSPEAKAIYSYICSFAGSGTTAFPGADLMMHELNLGKNRFYKFRKELEENGYITVIKQRNGNRREKNIYMLNTEPVKVKKVEHLQNEDIQNEGIQIEEVQSEDIQNEPSNSNSLNSNSLNSNSSISNNYNNKNSSSCLNKDIYDFYSKSGFGLLNHTIIEMLDADIEIYGKEWVKEALTEAVRNGKYKLKYAEGILRNWKADGRNVKGKEVQGNGSTGEDLGTKLRDEGIGFNIEDLR